MIFRRKKSDGFDWHEYVRTTIQLRRDKRRARLEDIGRAAAGHAKNAGEAAIGGVAMAAQSSGRATAAVWRKTIGQPAVAFPLILVGGMALLSGIYRWFAVAPDQAALVPLVLGLIMTILVAPLAIAHLRAPRLKLGGLKPGQMRLPAVIPGDSIRRALPFATAVVAALTLGWYAWGRAMPGQWPSSFANSAGLPAATSRDVSNSLEGRATALSGEMIRLQGRLLHLSGIEAPDKRQTCTRSNQPWRCGEAATAALERLTRAKPFRCTTQGAPDAAGRMEAACTVDGRDVAAELVREGHVFSVAAYFGGYAALETEARRSGTGLWAGAADRPADYRAKIWATAKASAPNGCPIKGQLSGGHKTYLMPWAQRYATASVRLNRGEAWFCTEAEAQAAGFLPDGTRTATPRKLATR